jgi:hypothetical protein
VAQDIHGRKDVNGTPMRMIIEANPVADGRQSGHQPEPHRILSIAKFRDLRAAPQRQHLTTAQYVQPDYLIVQSEPDTEVRDDYRPELNTPATDVAMVQQFVTNLNSANIAGLHSSIKLGSGMGAWQANWQQYLGTPGADTGILGITGLDGIDNHVYYLTGQRLVRPGQRVGCLHADDRFGEGCREVPQHREFWPHKSLIVGESNIDVDTRDDFAFWAPLDQQYIPIIFELANQGSLEYLSAFNDGEFYAYEPYASMPCLPVYPPARDRRTVLRSFHTERGHHRGADGPGTRSGFEHGDRVQGGDRTILGGALDSIPFT